MHRIKHIIALVCKSLYHIHLLFKELYNLSRAGLCSHAAEGQEVYSRELRRKSRKALYVYVPAGEYVGDGAHQTHLILGVNRDYVHFILLHPYDSLYHSFFLIIISSSLLPAGIIGYTRLLSSIIASRMNGSSASSISFTAGSRSSLFSSFL